jgi:hypothetical protein
MVSAMSLPRLTLALFVALQAADGAITYAAVGLFGPSAEANQLLVTWMGITGLGPTLLGAKLIACGCGVVLYKYGVNRILAFLTAAYMLFAVVPWLQTLAAMPLV